jgi:hydrogenase maturation factor
MAALASGKLPPELLASLLAAAPGSGAEVELGPALGEDACAIRVPAGALIAATDPITLTGAGVGAHAVWINANDIAVMGARPRWFLATVLLPEGTEAAEVRALFDSMGQALRKLGASLVGGHTEITGAVRQPVVVGQMLGLREDGRFVRTGGASPGDVVVQVGSAPIEGAAVLAAESARALQSIEPALLEAARDALERPGISVVEPALLATGLGATALHDPTEGGLSSGLYELAAASGVALRVEPDALLWFEPGLEVCRAVGADPWGTLASGTLLAAFPAARAGAAVEALRSRGLSAAEVGSARAGAGVELAGGGPVPRFARDEVARILSNGREPERVL